MIVATRRFCLLAGWLLLALIGGGSAVAVRAAVLVYHDGTRLPGEVVAVDGETIVFRSPRFGEVRASRAEARVESALPSDPPATAQAPSDGAPPSTPPVGVATAAATEPTDRWRGRFAIALENGSDSRDRTSLFLEGRLERTVDRNRRLVRGSYEVREEDGARTTDVLRFNGELRHDWPRHFYVQYLTQAEYNRSFQLEGFPLDYVLVRQDLNFGVRVLEGRLGTLRAGVGPVHLFLWLPDFGITEGVWGFGEYLEGDLKLPWAVSFTGRLARVHEYDSFHDAAYETEAELTKKLTAAFGLTLRYENRRDVPGVTVQNRELLRVLLGYDF